MSIRIGIVEDEKEQADYLKRQLVEWHNQFQIKEELKCDIYYNGEYLLEHLDRDYEIIFIDIELKRNENGIMLARKLRFQQFRKEIVFLTSHTEYVFEGYGVRALDFCIKPVTVSKLEKSMRVVLDNKNSGYYIFKDKKDGNIKKCAYADILYFMSAKHCVEIVTMDRSYREIKVFQNLVHTLPTDFIQCHRTVIVNMKKVQELKNGNEIMLDDGEHLPVSRSFWKEVKNIFTKQFSDKNN